MPRARHLKILLVDDEEFDADLLRHKLSFLKFPLLEMFVRADGQGTLEAVRDHAPDLVFLDYHLADVDGVELIRRCLAANPDLAIVLITAHGSEAVAVEAMKAGAIDYLVKGSFTLEALERTLRAALERRDLRRTVRLQQEALLAAERQRVMLESIGAACHHFAQPVTALLGRLELILQEPEGFTEHQRGILEECLANSQRMMDLLSRFQRVREYRTIPYIEETEILDIENGGPESAGPTSAVTESR